MTQQLTKLANDIYRHLVKPRTNPDYPGQKLYLDTEEMGWDGVRDYCDTRTGGELDCTQLDILTDMVTKRLIAKEQSDNSVDPENIYGLSSIAQSIAEDRK